MIQELITTIKKICPCAYQAFLEPQVPPFSDVLGAGQYHFGADNKTYFRRNVYEAQLYFVKKDPQLEDSFEDALIDDGWIIAEKSEDTFLEGQDITVIYYTLTKV